MGGFLGFREPVLRLYFFFFFSLFFTSHLVENLDVNEEEPYSKKFLIEMIVEDQDRSSYMQSIPALCDNHTVNMQTAEHWEDIEEGVFCNDFCFFFSFRVVHLIQCRASYILNASTNISNEGTGNKKKSDSIVH